MNQHQQHYQRSQPEEITDQNLDLGQECKEFFEKKQQFEAVPFDSQPEEFYYLISAKWLEKYLQYIRYQDNVQNEQFQENLNLEYDMNLNPGPINKDIVDENTNLFFYRDPQSEDDYRNTKINSNLLEKQDYEIINEDIWTFLQKKYDGIMVKRKSYINNNEKKVEVYLKQIKIILFHQKVITSMDETYRNQTTLRKFNQHVLQVSHWEMNSVEDLLAIFQKLLQQHVKNVNSFSFNLWLYNKTIPLEKTFKEMQKVITKSPINSLKVYIDAKLLKSKKSAQKTISKNEPTSNYQNNVYNSYYSGPPRSRGDNDEEEETKSGIYHTSNGGVSRSQKTTQNQSQHDDEEENKMNNEETNNDVSQQEQQQPFVLEDDDLLFFEIFENYPYFYNNVDFFLTGSCEFCRSFKELKIQCACKQTAYCSDSCKKQDKVYHKRVCTIADEQELQDQYQLKNTQNSVLGLCGLQNLGNTCYMNSGIQCLSNCNEITEFFLQDKFINEINYDNPLGSNGNLARTYAGLMKEMWYGSSSSTSPWNLKGAIANKQPMFGGYGQQDSQELLSFLIDLLHEDLNRVKKKPYIETNDMQPNEIEEEYAAKSWYNHLQRNQSIITDYMHGQYKSKLVCPDCNKISITFDPFSMIQLAIPSESYSKQEFIFAGANFENPIKFEMQYKKELQPTVKDLMQKTALFFNVPESSLVINKENAYFEEVEPVELTNSLGYMKNYQTGTAEIKIRQLNIDNNDENQIFLDVFLTTIGGYYYNSSESIRKCFNVSIQEFNKKTTLKQLHLDFFKKFKHCFDFSPKQNDKDDNNGDLNDEEINTDKINDEKMIDEIKTENNNTKVKEEEVIEPEIPDQEKYEKFFINDIKNKHRPYSLYVRSNKKNYYSSCYFCGERCDQQCFVEYQDQITLADLLEKVPKNEISQYSTYTPTVYKLQFEVFFRSPKKDFQKDEYQKPIDLSQELYAEIIQKQKQNLNLNQNNGNENTMQEENKVGDLEQQKSNNASPTTKRAKKIIENKHLKIQPINASSCKNENTISIYDSLNYMHEPEILNNQNMWYCSNCKEPKQATKQVEIYKAPQILILHLKRFKDFGSYNRQKITDLIDFPLENLDLTEYLIDQSLPDTIEQIKQKEQEKNEQTVKSNQKQNKDQKVSYDLFATSNHSGNLGFGHYTAYAKNKHDNQWHYFNDSSVSSVHKQENIVCETSYLLFYRRKQQQQNSENQQEQQLHQNFLQNSQQNQENYEELN